MPFQKKTCCRSSRKFSGKDQTATECFTLFIFCSVFLGWKSSHPKWILRLLTPSSDPYNFCRQHWFTHFDNSHIFYYNDSTLLGNQQISQIWSNLKCTCLFPRFVISSWESFAVLKSYLLILESHAIIRSIQLADPYQPSAMSLTTIT